MSKRAYTLLSLFCLFIHIGALCQVSLYNSCLQELHLHRSKEMLPKIYGCSTITFYNTFFIHVVLEIKMTIYMK